MPTITIMNQIITELAAEFTELALRQDLYLAPAITEIPARRSFAIQVCDGGSTYTDFEGGVKREHFSIVVGIIKTYKSDFSERAASFLSDATESMFVLKERISDKLEGSFLLVEAAPLLTRPLRITQESKIYRGRSETSVYIKELTFLGGLNEMR